MFGGLLKSTAKEILTDAFPIIEQFSPALATAIGGPPGFAVGFILPILAHTFGAKPTDIKQLVSNIKADPQSQSKLKQIENDCLDILRNVPSNMNQLVSCKINLELEWNPNTNNAQLPQ